jgi:RNA recognition motif-containing protein
VTRLFVSHLEQDTTGRSVRALFETYGNVDRLRMSAKAAATQAKRFAFVDMPDADANEAIRALHGSPSGADTLRVIRARAARSLSREAAG